MKTQFLDSSLCQLIQDFFCKNLINQRNVSQRTIISYRDTIRLLLLFAEKKLKKPPVEMSLDDLDNSVVLDFLNHLEDHRKNSTRTRNARLAAIRSFMKYVGYREPTALPVVQRVRSIPVKRFKRHALEFLSREEVQAILDSPDKSTWSGQRDRVMFATFYNTGARVSEIIELKVSDLELGRTSSVKINGKGRKQRVIPIWKSTALQLKKWLKVVPNNPEAVVFPSRYGQKLTDSGVEYRLKEAVKIASKRCPSLRKKKISPHTIRHTTAMHLLQSGTELTLIALWLGHESLTTTHLYLDADLEMKERALKKLKDVKTSPLRFKAGDKLLRFLEAL
jgi:site-specific recombinase XerD